MPELTGGIRLQKDILTLKLGGKYNICDRMIFNLVQCGIHESRKIGYILDIFPYEFLAESLAKLHNNGLIFINMNTGEIQLTSEVQEIAELYSDGQLVALSSRMVGNLNHMMQNFNGTRKVIL